MVKKYNILVTGVSGQLGNEIRKLSTAYDKYYFTFTDRNKLDISNYDLLMQQVKGGKINLLINCAAYTDVNKAEYDRKNVDLVNNISVDNIARTCFENKVQLIHVSTDFVFDGLKKSKYNEFDKPNPINVYGISKLEGEKRVFNYDLNKSIIIRTSWLYSDLENNFVSKIYNKIKSNQDIMVIGDEFGSPTNAKDLAKTILEIIPKLNNKKTQIYHYCNAGMCSRFDLANEINTIINGKSNIISTNFIDSKVNRPKFSALDSERIINDFEIKIKHWKESLHDHFKKVRTNNYSFNEIS